jgi:hypothetical protein
VHTRLAYRLLVCQVVTPAVHSLVSRALEQAAQANFREKRRFEQTEGSHNSIQKAKSRSAGMTRDDLKETISDTGGHS